VLWALVPSLAAAFTPDRGFPLPLSLSARLLVETPLSELGVEAGTLNLPLELPKGSIKTLSIVYDHFQGAPHSS